MTLVRKADPVRQHLRGRRSPEGLGNGASGASVRGTLWPPCRARFPEAEHSLMGSAFLPSPPTPGLCVADVGGGVLSNAHKT